MSQLQKGDTFIDGQVVTAARLNNLVDQATALTGLILDQSVSTVSPNDQVLIWDDGTGALRRVTLAALFTDAVGVTSVSLNMPAATFNVSGSPVTAAGGFNVAWQSQSPNTMLCGPPSGGSGTPAFRALNPADTIVPTVTIPATTIDWRTGNMFSKVLSANPTSFGFANPTEGQTIRVRLQSGGSGWVVNWLATIRWPGGVAHTMTSGAGRIDICTFSYIGGLYYGTFAKDFLL